MYFKLFHELKTFAAQNPQQITSATLETLEQFTENQRKEVNARDRNFIFHTSDSSSDRIELF